MRDVGVSGTNNQISIIMAEVGVDGTYQTSIVTEVGVGGTDQTFHVLVHPHRICSRSALGTAGCSFQSTFISSPVSIYPCSLEEGI